MSSQSSSQTKSSRASAAKKGKSKTQRPNPGGPSATQLFTPIMQDAQARNKDPYESSSSDSPFDGSNKRFDHYGNDTYDNVQRRREAAVVLDCPELLMMHAQARNDSIPGTRHYFTKLVCGYIEDDDAYSALPPPDKEVYGAKVRPAWK